jgi:hypothetical protein
VARLLNHEQNASATVQGAEDFVQPDLIVEQGLRDASYTFGTLAATLEHLYAWIAHQSIRFTPDVFADTLRTSAGGAPMKTNGRHTLRRKAWARVCDQSACCSDHRPSVA